MTLVRNRAFADVIKDLKIKPSRVFGGPPFNDWGPYKKRKQRDTGAEETQGHAEDTAV